MVSNVLPVALSLLALSGCAAVPARTATTVPAPLYEDAVYHGSCDPEIVWNEATGRWAIYYTARRATRLTGTYVGTPIGVVSSSDLVHWRFDGYVDFAESGRVYRGQADMPVTFWAPAIVSDGKRLHMFVTFKDNAVPPWGGDGVIRHYSAPLGDPVRGWTLEAVPDFAQPDPIDATVVRVGESWRAYYRVGKGGGIQWAESGDLTTWINRGQVRGDVNTDPPRFNYQEAPYVWRMAGTWWMITDPHEGLAVYRSDDGIEWRYNTTLLVRPGARAGDGSVARHPSVAVTGDRAFLVYHVEPGRDYAVYGRKQLPAEKRPVSQKKSVLQMAELELVRGTLTADRDAPIILPTEARP